jgi:MFS transporter, PPP family, 3-phenylpropionic acid transporter
LHYEPFSLLCDCVLGPPGWDNRDCPTKVSLRSPVSSSAFRTSGFVSTLMMSASVAYVGLALWLADHGIGPERIGLINALPLIVVVLLSVSVGRLADRASDWRGAIVACSAVAAAASAALFFVHSFWAIAIVWTLTTAPLLLMIPVVDAATVRMAARIGVSYGAIRVWGTIGYIVVAILTGWLMQAYGDGLFVGLLAAASALRLGIALLLPQLRAPEKPVASEAIAPPNRSEAAELKDLLRPWFLAPVLAGSLLSGSHSVLNGFSPLLWKREGVSEGLIGIYLAVGPIAEIVAMLMAGRLLARFEPRRVMIACCLIGVVRWCGLVAPPWPPLVALLQTLHLVTFVDRMSWHPSPRLTSDFPQPARAFARTPPLTVRNFQLYPDVVRLLKADPASLGAARFPLIK